MFPSSSLIVNSAEPQQSSLSSNVTVPFSLSFISPYLNSLVLYRGWDIEIRRFSVETERFSKVINPFSSDVSTAMTLLLSISLILTIALIMGLLSLSTKLVE